MKSRRLREKELVDSKAERTEDCQEEILGQGVRRMGGRNERVMKTRRDSLIGTITSVWKEKNPFDGSDNTTHLAPHFLGREGRRRISAVFNGPLCTAEPVEASNAPNRSRYESAIRDTQQ